MTDETMTLGEALTVRADLQGRLGELRGRMLAVAKVQEGDAPAENPGELIGELDRVAADLTRLIQQINRTNAASTLADGTTVSDALAQRDVLAKQHAVFRDLAATATVDQTRYSRSEVVSKLTQSGFEVDHVQADRRPRLPRPVPQPHHGNWANTLTE